MPCLKFFFFFSRVKPGGWRRGDVRNELAGSQPSNLHPISERIALVYAGLTFFLMLAVRLCSVGCAQPLPQSIEAIRLTRSSRERRTPAPLTHTLSLSVVRSFSLDEHWTRRFLFPCSSRRGSDRTGSWYFRSIHSRRSFLRTIVRAGRSNFKIAIDSSFKRSCRYRLKLVQHT